MFPDFKNSFPKNPFGIFIYILSGKHLFEVYFRLLRRNNELKINNFLTNIWHDNWRFIICHRKRPPLIFQLLVFLPARFDACWVVGDVCGNFLSGIVFDSLGYYGTYTVYGFCLVIAIIYLLFAKEPIQRVSTQKYDSKLKLLKRIFVDSVKGRFHLHLLVFPFVYQLYTNFKYCKVVSSRPF